MNFPKKKGSAIYKILQLSTIMQKVKKNARAFSKNSTTKGLKRLKRTKIKKISSQVFQIHLTNPL